MKLDTFVKTSKTNPLFWAFCTQGMHEYATRVLENKEQVMNDMKNGFVAPEAWIECAELFQKLDKQ